jgi:hypothetical protein
MCKKASNDDTIMGNVTTIHEMRWDNCKQMEMN